MWLPGTVKASFTVPMDVHKHTYATHTPKNGLYSNLTVSEHKRERKGKNPSSLGVHLVQKNAEKWIWYVYVPLRGLCILLEKYVRCAEF